MSSSFWKLKALLKKNFYEMKRNVFSTLVEILFPIIVILLFYILKTIFDVDNHEFDIEEGSLKNFTKKRSVFNSNIIPQLNMTPNITNNIDNIPSIDNMIPDIEIYGMSIQPTFRICSLFGLNSELRSAIATIGVPDVIKEKMIKESTYFSPYTGFLLNRSNFMDFENEDEMNNYLKSSEYGKNKDNPLICFGISFSEDKINHKYNYSLHYFDNNNERYEGMSDVPKSSFLRDPFQTNPDFDSYSKYQHNGYTYIMKIITDYIYSQEVSNETKINFGILPMKYNSYKSDRFGSIIGEIGPFFIICSYVSSIGLYVYRMVFEKETRVKEGMKIMGLTDGIYFLSYLIQYIIISIFDSVVISFLFLLLFTKTPFIVLFLMIFLFSLNVFSLAFCFQSFIEKAKESLILSLILYFLMFFFYMLVVSDNSSYIVKVGLSVFPCSTIYFGFNLLGKFEANYRQFYIKDIFYTYTNYSILIMYIMLVSDFFIYLFLGYYLQNILKHDFGISQPWYFIFTSKYWGCRKHHKNIIIEERPSIENKKKLLIDDEDQPNEEYFQNEDIYKEMTDPKDSLKIKEIVKRFDDGKVAVNHVSLNIYKNEIFALLGHNGAGKTTLISMLTGLYEATNGEAIYNNMNILLPENIGDFRGKLGICPQHDVLFKDLNIREHLEMFSVFKGVPSENVEAEINKIIKDFQLEEYQYTLAKNLSAGLRRKLSIAIALVGGSEIIFLDEPSSGMDITSRRNLWEILKRLCDNKIIILTTHYMEEASVLGKRIGIINLGKMKCLGTPLFLIEKFGKYMNLTLRKEEGALNDTICEFITSLVGEAKFESLTEEILVRIEKNIFNEPNQISLNKFFEELDTHLSILKIKSYSVSMPTLEDVFLNVVEDDKNNRFSLKLDTKKANDTALFELNFLNKFTSFQKFLFDMKSTFIRRFYLTIREKKGIIMEVFCPIILILIGCIISKIDPFYSTPIFGSKDLNALGKQIIYYSALDESINKENYFIKNMENVTSQNLTTYIPYMEQNQKNKSLAIYNFIETVYNSTKDIESSNNKLIDMNGENYVGCYGNMLLLNEPNELNKNYEFVELVNLRVIQGVPLFTSAFLEQIIKKASNNKVSINYQHKVMGKTSKQEENYSYSSNNVVLFVAVAYALIPANIIAVVVKERINNSKHLMKLAGMNLLSYWIVNFLYEFIKFYLTGGICLLILYLFDYYTPYLINFYLMYGPPLILVTYILSFLFKDDSEAQFTIILLHSMIGTLCSTLIMFFREVEKTKYLGKILEYIFCLIPSFCFCFAYNLGRNRILVYEIDFYDKMAEYILDDSKLMEEFILLLGPFCFLVGETIIYLIILILIEKLSNKELCYKNQIENINNNIEQRDSGVIKEEIKSQTEKNNINDINEYNQDLINTNNKENNYIVRVKNLQKEYLSSIYKIFFCCKKNKGTIAIKNLNFCLEKGECFGLLGLNGAGKTTTFKCITQEITPTNGDIFLNGIRTNNNFDEIKNKFGYCPQYDAIFEYMTVYENLEFYAKLKGVKKDFMTQIINTVIYEMKLDEFIKKLAGNLSGGNKRKLSVAISMLCSPPIILLDEPSRGMDPEARRFMWSIIHKLSTMARKSSIIMTTHSMDEAETLCKRMGIMVNGEFVCLGKANEIKNKYGYGYELNIRIKPLSDDLEEKLFLNKYNLDKKMKVNMNNIEDILEQINKKNYMDELEEGRLGEKLIRYMEKSNEVSINYLLSWIFYVQNAIKFVQYGKNNFLKIIIEEHMDNSFSFKMKKKNEDNKSIGYLFGLFETYKEECYITEYSLQETSLEQIFNKFAENQVSQIKEGKMEANNPGDDENISLDDNIRRKTHNNQKIVLSDELAEKLLNG